MSEIEKITKEKPKGAQEQEADQLGNSAGKTDWYFSIGINPLGFLQFGPSVEVEAKIYSSLYLLGVLRWHGGGLLSYLFSSDLTPSAIAFGGGLRYYFKNDKTRNAPYVGFQGQYGYCNTAGSDDVGNYQGLLTYIVVAGEGGYRWCFDPIFLSVGLLAGLENTFQPHYWYLSDPGTIYNSKNYTQMTAAIMLTLTFGFEF
jgi:hypothetical protein